MHHSGLFIEKQKIREEYAELRRVAQVVDGTWDDHDYGLNDGKCITHNTHYIHWLLTFFV